MNLIEQLGGYRMAKEVMDSIPKDGRSYTITRDDTGIIFNTSELHNALLEHRRQHNIFESEDKIVVKNNCLIDFADLALNLKVLTVLMMTDEGFIRSIEATGLFKSSLVRHATDLEIAAGHRL